MNRDPLPARVSVGEATALLDRCTADLSATIQSTPISADLIRIRAVIAQRKPARFTVAEVSELERTHEALVDALADHRQGAFSVADLLGAVFDAGYQPDECGGDPAVFMGADERTDFYVAVSLAAPRHANAILKAANWSDSNGCFWWDAKEIARLAA